MNKKFTKESLEMDMTTYKKVKGTLDPKEPVKITGDKPVPTTSTMTEENIEPQDSSTIKYLSNVKDPSSGKVSKPFNIDGKNYQIVRGTLPSKEIVMGVYCHDDLNESGENIIHPMDHFEKTIAGPMRERETMATEETKQDDSFEGDKHFLVNTKTGAVRNFRTIKDLVSQNKLDEEDYMGVKEFKQYMTNKMFGSRKKPDVLSEVSPTGEETDEEMNLKAKKLMVLIQKRIPENVITTIKTPVAKREVIAAFAEMIGVPRNGLTSLLSGLKVLAKEPVQALGTTTTTTSLGESKVITKKELLKDLGLNTDKK